MPRPADFGAARLRSSRSARSSAVGGPVNPKLCVCHDGMRSSPRARSSACSASSLRRSFSLSLPPRDLACTPGSRPADGGGLVPSSLSGRSAMATRRGARATSAGAEQGSRGYRLLCGTGQGPPVPRPGARGHCGQAGDRVRKPVQRSTQGGTRSILNLRSVQFCARGRKAQHKQPAIKPYG